MPSCFRRVAWSVLAALAVSAVFIPPVEASPPTQRGAALGLFSEDPSWSYVDMLDEMAAAGVSHVAITVPYYLKTARASEIYRHPRFSMPMETVRRTVLDARKRGMEIFLFPILRVEDERHGWRGQLAPTDVEAFYTSYTAFILSFARLAEELRVPLLCVGSELSTMDIQEERWRRLIAQVRAVYHGKLTYSANWDHYEAVRFVDALDYAGVTGYFELATAGESPSVEQLIEAWRVHYLRLMRWQHKVGRPLLLTEVGYLSQKNAAAWPWKEGADEPLDLELQRRCYEAVRRIWDGEERLAGLYFWNWFGWGGETSKEYTPRNKPAAKEVAKWFKNTAPRPPQPTP